MANAKHVLIGDGQNSHGSVLDAAVRSMCSHEVLNGRYLVQMPVTTRSGSLVSVSVWPEGDGSTFLVSDDGIAHYEVMCALASPRLFNRIASNNCAKVGASFDNGSMLLMRVPAGRLKGAIISMAALIKDVIDETIEKSFSDKIDRQREQFISQVGDAFKDCILTESAQIIGHSTAEHKVDVLVEVERGQVAFDFFSKSGGSINAIYTKFSDIHRIEHGPATVGVTPDFKLIGPKLTLISSVAKVIEVAASSERYRRAAA